MKHLLRHLLAVTAVLALAVSSHAADLSITAASFLTPRSMT
jgi:hypothetical protein